MIKGADYADNAYNVVPDAIGENGAPAWANPQIKVVNVTTSGKYLFKEVTVEAATQDKETKAITAGAFVVKAKSISTTCEDKLYVTVKDIWGYEKTFEVPVTIEKK